MNVKSIRPIPKEAFCIGCGCSDSKACLENNQACYWLKLDREKQIGVCSNCKGFLSKFGEL